MFAYMPMCRGTFAFMLDEDLSVGESGPCSTFDWWENYVYLSAHVICLDVFLIIYFILLVVIFFACPSPGLTRKRVFSAESVEVWEVQGLAGLLSGSGSGASTSRKLR
jgi:hypothetical protein